MRRWLTLVALCSIPWSAVCQDIEGLLDRAPTVSMVVAKALDRIPAFGASVEVQISGPGTEGPSVASGRVEFQSGSVRWEVRFADVHSPLVTQQALAAARQLNGDRFVVLTRPDQKANFLVLARARAYLEQPLPALRLALKSRRQGTEELDGQVCVKERVTATIPGMDTKEVILWKAKSYKNMPVQIQFTDAGMTIRVHFRDVRFRASSSARFDLPPGLTRHSSIEDLIQSVVIDRMRKRMGLD